MHNKFINHSVAKRLWWYLFFVFLLRAGRPFAQSSRASSVVRSSSSIRGSQRQKTVVSTAYQPFLSSKLEAVPVEQLQRRRLQSSNATATGEIVVNTAKNVTDAVADAVTGTYKEVQGTPPNQWSTKAWIIVVVVVVALICLICCLWKIIC
jgi:hypothetical protein